MDARGGKGNYPTDPITILEPQSPSIDEFSSVTSWDGFQSSKNYEKVVEVNASETEPKRATEKLLARKEKERCLESFIMKIEQRLTTQFIVYL